MSILAVGAWLKNTVCLLQNDRVLWSSTHGDLSDPAACLALEESVQKMRRLACLSNQPVRAIAHDLHPDFYSTQLALQQARAWQVPAVGVQHHHAHMAAVMAEHQLSGPVLGLALDGVGFGTDGKAWGGELLWVNGAEWRRLGHLTTLALPGGDRAAREPWRMAASALQACGRGAEIVPRWGPVVGENRAQGLHSMLEAELNCPLTSSTGRWFDAAAAALGVSVRQHEEAQAAMALENLASRWLARHPDARPAIPKALVVPAENGLSQLDLRSLWASLLDTPVAEREVAAARFHLGLVDGLARWVQAQAQILSSSRSPWASSPVVCLGGGCFLNRILRDRLTQQLQALGFQVHWPAQKMGDDGLAWGQAWVASHRLSSAADLGKEMTTCV